MQRGFLTAFLLCAALAVVAAPARAEQDAVQFFGNIEVTPTTPIHDAICFFCSVRARGEVKGDIVVFFGNVRLDGRVHQDVVNFFGQVTASDSSSIGGDLVSFFGSVHLGENVTVGQDLVAMFGTVHAPPTVSVGQDHVVFSPWFFFGPLLMIFLVIFVIVYEVHARRYRFTQPYPFPPRQ